FHGPGYRTTHWHTRGRLYTSGRGRVGRFRRRRYDGQLQAKMREAQMNREAVLVIAELMWALRRSGAHTFARDAPRDHGAAPATANPGGVGLQARQALPPALGAARRAHLRDLLYAR